MGKDKKATDPQHHLELPGPYGGCDAIGMGGNFVIMHSTANFSAAARVRNVLTASEGSVNTLCSCSLD